MTAHKNKTNAAIWYAADGYEPEAKGVNGRRVAGASFLKGFVQNADVDELVSLSQGQNGAKAFEAHVRSLGTEKPVRSAFFFNARKMAPVDVLYYPAPNYAAEAWRRQTLGTHSYSICGITHTTATAAVMQGQADLRAAPQMEWDAVICTSHAVKASMDAQYAMIDRYFIERFGKAPVRPQMPVIPLGLNTADYAHQPAARARLRKRMNWGAKDIVISTLSRLTPYGKFDPFPLFLAMEAAAKRLPTGLKLHFVACGIYIDGHSEKIFEQGAKKLMPSVSYTHLDGTEAERRHEALSGADIFTFPIDNIQETFGLAPLEAMAAGLPVLTTDWDGMRDTVTADVGIRVPTRSLPAAHGAMEAWSYQSKRNSYAQYGQNISAVTEVDLGAMTDAIVALASDPEQRKALGQAGLKRVREVFDWSAIIPQYQELWGELSNIRQTAAKDIAERQLYANPVAPSPMELFAGYPSEQLPRGVGLCVAAPADMDLEGLYELRGYARLKNPFEKVKTLRQVLDVVHSNAPKGCTAGDVAKALKINPVTADRCFVWLLKYGLIQRAS